MQLHDKRKIRKKILELVNKGKSLTAVKHEVLFILHLPHLPSILDNYVDYKYFKYCQQNVENELRFKIPTWGASRLRQVTTKIFTARRLTELPTEVTDLLHFKLIANENRILAESDKLKIFHRIQSVISETVSDCTAGALCNTDKVTSLLQLVKEQATLVLSAYNTSYYYDCDYALDGLNIPNSVVWKEFKRNHPKEAFEHKKLYQKHQYKIQTLLNELRSETLLRDSVNKSVKSLLTELHETGTTETLHQNGRQMIVRKKPVMPLSCVLDSIEDLMEEDQDVEEVHLIATEVIYIDCDLEKKTWHGKNILVMSKKIECIVPGVVWDVGGLDGESWSNSRASNGTDGSTDGKNGRDGKPGESGGYGMLIADKFVNMNYLTFSCNGGDGGNGQSGGDGKQGRNGHDGEEMSMDELKRDFESPAKFGLLNARRTVASTIPHVLKTIDTMEYKWTYDINLETGKLEGLGIGTWSCYMRGLARRKLHIEFAFYFKDVPAYTTRHCYILVKGAAGTAGTPGGLGGEGGCGAEGGYAGTLTASYLNGQNYKWENSPVYLRKNGSNGDHGKDGKDGPRGKCGNNGRDVGYVDSMWWGEPVYYGPGTYKLKNFDVEQDSSVWCPHIKKWRKLVDDQRDPPQPLEHQRQKQRRTKLNVAAGKKNTIISSQVLDMYANEVKHSSCSAQLDDLEFEQNLQDVMTSNQNFSKRNKVKAKTMVKIRISKPTPSTRKKHWRQRGRNIIRSAFRCKEEESPEEQIMKARFQTLEAIRGELSRSWKNWSKTKEEHEKHPTSTKSYCSALHALFGEKNNLGYFEAHGGIRKEVCGKLKKYKFSDKEKNHKAVEYLWNCFLAYFQDKSQPLQEKWGATPSTPTPHLDKLCRQFEEDPENFDWRSVSKDTKAIQEYIEFLEEPAIPFLTSDLKLVAEVYEMSLKIYVTYNGTPTCLPLESISISDDDHQTAEFHIAVNENHEFSRMVPVVKRDVREIVETMKNVVNEVYSCTNETELKDYLNEHKYGTKALPKLTVEDETLLEIVRDISQNVSDCDERLVVETALLGWPSIMVQVFHDKLVVADRQCMDKFQDMIRLTFSKITEYTLRQNSADKLAELLWIISTYPLEKWVGEILIIFGEEHFKNVKTEDINEWRKIITNAPAKLVVAIMKLVEAGFDKGDKQSFTEFLKQTQEYERNEHMDFGKLSGVSRTQWPYQFHKLYISSKLEMLPNVGWNEDNNKFSQSLYYLHSLYNGKANQITKLLDTLHKVLDKQGSASFWSFSKLLQRNDGNIKKCTGITQILSNFYGGQWDLDAKCIDLLGRSETVEQWMSLLHKQTLALSAGSSRSLEEIKSIVEVDSNSTLSAEDIRSVVTKVKSLDTIRMPENFSTNFDSAMVQWVQKFQSKIKGKTMDSRTMKEQLEAVAVINMVIEMKLGYNLRPTQKFAIISALCLGAKGSNLLSQIATGEGKTCIVLAVGIVKGLFKEKVDVVTSSGVLAQRDATSYRSIYSAFGLSVGEVTGDNQDARVRAYQCDIVYGESSHFQRDHLLDRFYNQNIRGSRTFSNVIVDEVDSMFLDKGNSVLYLSHQPPDLDSLESVFVFIWSNVVRTVNSGEFHPMSIHELVLSAIYPTVSPENLLTFLEGGQVNALWDWMVSKNIINGHGRLLLSDIHKIQRLMDQLPRRHVHIKNQLTHLLKTTLESPGRLSVMNYLKPFVEQHLLTWVNKAAHATQLTEGKEYVVDVDHSKTSLDKNPKIMILDLNTGVDLKQTQWSEGLHQFLQLKHGCRLSLMSLKAVFVSNISFFNKYQCIFGLTGTIGTESDRNFLKMTYKVEVLCMPLALPKRFIEWEPKIMSDLTSWKQQIFEECKDIVEAGRSALIICGTVQEAEILHAHILSMNTFSSSAIELYRRDYETFQATEEGRSLETGLVLIATNLAGRGTDIKLSPKLKENGGLHVILSYLPDNLRVEQQAFGRASRCGDPGTGRLVAVDTLSIGSQESFEGDDAINLKIKRDDIEMSRVSDIQGYYNNVIKKEEIMFESFRESFERLTGSLDKAYKYIKDHEKGAKDADETRKMISGNINEVRELVMYSLLDDWAFWLDRYSTLLISKQNPDKLTLIDKGLHQFELDEYVLIQDFQRMTGRYEDVSVKYEDPGFLQSIGDFFKRTVGVRNEAQIEGYALSLIHEPALLVKVGKCMINRKDYDSAIRYLDKVVEEERDHSVVALYYKVLCKLNLKEVNSIKFDKMIESIREMLDEYRIRQSGYCNMTQEIQFVDTQNILHGGGYRKQKENVMKLLGIYRQSIDNMVGSERILPNDFASLCNDNASMHLCEYLMKEGALLRPQFIYKRDPEKIQKLADSFCLNKEKMISVLKQFSEKYLVAEEERKLKKELDLPSRSDFWKQIRPCLERTTEFAVIQGDDENNSDNKEEKVQNDFTRWISGTRPFISKYGSDMSASTQNQILKRKKVNIKKEQKFIRLRKVGKLCYDQVGYLNLEKLKTLKMEKYHKIETGTFSIIPGVGERAAGKIFEILQQHRIIDETGVLLSTEWTKDKLKLSLEFEVYRNDILSILHSKCRYQYELLSLIYQFELVLKVEQKKPGEQESTELKISLPSRPCKDFIMTAMELGFVLGMRANPSYFNDSGGNFFSKVFREPVSWAKWVKKKTGGPIKPCFSRNDLIQLFPNETNITLSKLYEELKTQKWINSDGEIILAFSAEKGLQQLSSQFEYHQPEILSLAQWRKEMVKENFLRDVLAIVYESQGKLKTLQSPDGNMVELEKKLEGFPDKGADFQEQVHMFTLSGFDHVIDTIEETYTWKMIFSAIAVIIIGLVQIGIGIWLEFITSGVGTFVAGGLIQEGISDVIYGLMSFYSGHFSWQDWVDHKWRSIAITCATMSIGALIARGVKFSKYGLKLFGNADMSGRVVQETLKQSGKAGVSRSIIPVLMKSFGYKVLHGCAVAGASMAASFAYDKALKKFVDHISSQIFDNTYTAVNEHHISTTLSNLVDQVGVDKAAEIVERSRNHVLSNSSCEKDAQRYLAQLLTPAMHGLGEAMGKMNRVGTFSSQESTLLMNFLKVASHLMTTVAVLDALKQMKHSIQNHLSQMEREIEREIEMSSLNKTKTVGVNEREKRDFMYGFNEKTNAIMREQIGSAMRYSFIEPLMTIGCQKLLTKVGRSIRGAIVEYQEGKLMKKLDQVKFELESNPDTPLERKRELQRQMVQLCSQSRDPKVIAHAVEFGGPMGVECVQALANKLGVKIVVDSDNPNVPKEFVPQNGTASGATLHLKHSVTSDDPNDLGHWEAQTGGGNVDVGNYSADCLLDAVNQELKAAFPNGDTVGRGDLADFIRNDEFSKEFINMGWHHTYNSLGGFGGAQKCQQYEITEEEIAEKLGRREARLRDSGSIRDAADVFKGKKVRPGPITEIAFETIDEREVPVFQSGVITEETLANKQPRISKEAKAAKEAGGMKTDEAGHISARSWGAPSTTPNLFPQDGHMNKGVNNSIEKNAVKFIRENEGKNPSVEYKILLERNENLRPSGHIVHFVFKTELEGKTVVTRKTGYFLPNEPTNVERKAKRGPA